MGSFNQTIATQSNLVVTEEELKDIVQDSVNAEDTGTLFENLIEKEILKTVSEALSAFFRCEFIKVSTLNQNLEIFNGQYDSTVKNSPIHYGFDDLSKKFYHVSFRQESNETYTCLLYTSPSPRDATLSRMPSSA